ncbi:MAG: hypothetical protein OXG02_08565 [Chloroflexi bacterium]|nr:hypothetical protein [Chloroflexota bacterium]
MIAERVRAVHRIQQEMQANLMRTQNVVGHAIGYKISRGVTTDELALVALVREKISPRQLPSSQLLPRQVDDIPLDVVAVGQVVAQQSSRKRHRPKIPGGVSMGHLAITAGTFGMRVRDRRSGEILLLSNNHVLANANDAVVGDPIVQPGHVDGGRMPDDRVASLKRFIPLTFLDQKPPRYSSPDLSPPGGGVLPVGPGSQRRGCGRALWTISQVWRHDDDRQPDPAPEPGERIPEFSYNNRLDAALAQPRDAAMFPNYIQDIGSIQGSRDPALNLRVRKFGRTTGLTRGRIVLINATVDVAYVTNQGMRTAHFVGQFGTEAISEGGDSGSILVEDGGNLAIGLLFAGSDTRSFFTPIRNVLDALDVRIG